MAKIVSDIARIIFVVSVYILTFISLLGIWEVVKETDVLQKSMITVVLLGVASAIAILSAKYLDHADEQPAGQNQGGNMPPMNSSTNGPTQ